MKHKILSALIFGSLLVLFYSCNNYFKNDYKDNSPTSGKLKVYYDEGLYPHLVSEVYSFEAHYPEVKIELIQGSESEAIDALYKDSCEAIVISRQLNEKERKAFESKQFFPKYSLVAKSGVALITNINTPIFALKKDEIIQLLSTTNEIKDSLTKSLKLKVLLDKNNSSVMHYLIDSLLKGQRLSSNCNVLGSTIESINYAANNNNSLAFIDFAWLSDEDDSLWKANKGKIKIIGIKSDDGKTYEYPSQSSFKLGTYLFTRNVYVMRKTGDFTLAKGFESFVAGPKGQNIFLKQGLLPNRQSERLINVKSGQ
jgi:phosphate transport system substrate-binding protein